MKPPKPYNSGQWTEARRRAFIISALRKARWPVKYECIKKAFHSKVINPKTGRLCNAYLCAECGDIHHMKDIQADHIEPITPLTGFDDWGSYIERLFCEIDGFQALCKECHKVKTDHENSLRRKYKKENKK